MDERPVPALDIPTAVSANILEESKMTIDEMKHEALLRADEMEIAWEVMDAHPEMRKIFEESMQFSEQQHKNNLRMFERFDELDEPLMGGSLEEFREWLIEELIVGFQLQNIHERYRLVQSITEIA
jgi:hypothetical protein